MKVHDFGLIADENIDGDVVTYLRTEGFDIILVIDVLYAGAPDSEVLQYANQQRRVVITHDRDFGSLAIAAKQPFVGILFLRPGHIQPVFTIGSLRALHAQDPSVTPPFIIVLERTGNEVHMRIRQPLA